MKFVKRAVICSVSRIGALPREVARARAAAAAACQNALLNWREIIYIVRAR